MVSPMAVFESQTQSFMVVIAVVVVECSLSHIIDLWFLVLNAHLNRAFLLGFPLSNSSPHAERKPGLPPWSLTHRTGLQLIWLQEFWKSAPKPAASFPLARNRSCSWGASRVLRWLLEATFPHEVVLRVLRSSHSLLEQMVSWNLLRWWKWEPAKGIPLAL